MSILQLTKFWVCHQTNGQRLVLQSWQCRVPGYVCPPWHEMLLTVSAIIQWPRAYGLPCSDFTPRAPRTGGWHPCQVTVGQIGPVGQWGREGHIVWLGSRKKEAGCERKTAGVKEGHPHYCAQLRAEDADDLL